MESIQPLKNHTARLLSALAPRCPLCRTSNIRLARKQTQARWHCSGVCIACGIKFALNPLQAALHRRYAATLHQEISQVDPQHSKPSKRYDISDDSLTDVQLTIAPQLLERKTPKKESGTQTPDQSPVQPAEPSLAQLSVQSIEAQAADISALMTQLSSTIASSIRERHRWIDAKTSPKHKRASRKNSDAPSA